MAWWAAPFYDRILAPTEEACFQRWRAEVLSGLSGHVIEIGAGTGANVPHYPDTVERVVFSEPDPVMRRHLEQKLADARTHDHFAPAGAEVVIEHAHELPFDDDTFDAAVSTLVLCTVPDPEAALAELRRVVKPGGTFAFMEHVAAEDRPDRLRWQRRMDPVWKHLAGGCRLTRRTGQLIEAAGFRTESLTRESARKAPAIIRPVIRGTATLPADVAA